MDPVQRYAISLISPIGTHAPPRTVVVHWTADIVDGLPVYRDRDGTTQAVISTDHVARVLSADGTPSGPTLPAHPLP